MKLPKMKCCDFFKAFYYDYQDTFLNETNFPVAPKEGFCPFPKVSCLNLNRLINKLWNLFLKGKLWK